MKKFNAARGKGLIPMVGNMIAYNFLLIITMLFINSYEIVELFKICMIGINIYFVYYILIYITMNFCINEGNLYINSIFGMKKVKIPIDNIQAYKTSDKLIKSIRISGMNNSNYAIGRNMIEKLGNTYMYVSSNKNIIYIKTDKINYGISPENVEKFEEILNNNHVQNEEWDFKPEKTKQLFKDKRYFLPFIIISAIIVALTINPMILYLYNKLPDKMPLIFDAKFNAVVLGSGKQFAFKQMMYGALNMVVFFCMYYLSHFFARFDKNYAYKFLYLSLVLSLLFLIIQIRILYIFV